MNIVKFILLIFVLCICFMGSNPLIERFYPQVQGIPFKEEHIDDKLYMCKDSNDLPYSCHGQGVSSAVYDKYSNYTAPCPKNWLLPGNSIYS